MNIRIMVFDSGDKYRLLQEWLAGLNVTLGYAVDLDVAEAKIRDFKPHVLLFGGSDILGEDYAALQLWHKIKKLMPSIPLVLITTWNENEARIMKAVVPEAYYCPFSKGVANIIRNKLRMLREAPVSQKAPK